MASQSAPLCQQADKSLQPVPQSCRGGFDFSLLFEEVILGIVPLGFMVLILPWRIWHLFQKPRKVVPSALEYIKLVSQYLSLSSSSISLIPAVDVDLLGSAAVSLYYTVGAVVGLSLANTRVRRRQRRPHLRFLPPLLSLLRRTQLLRFTVFSPQCLSVRHSPF